MRFGRSRSPYSYSAHSSYSYYGRQSPSLLRRVGKVLLIVLAVLLVTLLIGAVVRFLMTRWPAADTSGPAVVIAPAAESDASTKGADTPAPLVAQYDEYGQLVKIEPSGAARPTVLPEKLIPTASGITLEAASAALAQLAVLEGAVYDPEHLQLLLIGQPGPSPFQPDDLRVAWRAALGDEDPTVTIDPGPTVGEMVVKFSGPVTGTHFGWVMYEADREMKTLALGKDNITGKPVQAAVPGFKTQLDLARELEGSAAQSKPSWHRFWFVPKGMRLALSADQQEVQFIQADLKVLTECMDAHLQPLKNCVAPAADAFAAHLTDHYDQYAQEFPMLNQLRELGKLLSLGKWLRDAGIEIDENWLALDNAATTEIPATTPAITVSTTTKEQQGNGVLTSTYSLYGGVNFQFANSYENLTLGAPSIRKRALAARPTEGASAWLFIFDGVEQGVAAISLKPESLPQLPAASTGDDLVLTQFDGAALGVIRKPMWDEAARRVVWTLDLPRLTVGRSGLYAHTENEQAESVPRKVTVQRHLGGQTEDFTFKGWTPDKVRVFESKGRDAKGKPRTITWTPADGYRLVNDEVQIEFDDLGRVRALQDANKDRFDFTFVGDELRHIGRHGDQKNQSWIDLTYQGKQLVGATSSKGQAVGYQYDAAGRLVRTVDGVGKTLARYEYGANEHLAVEVDGTTNTVRRNLYDESGVLSGIEQDGYLLKLNTVGKGVRLSVIQLPGEQADAAASEATARRDALQRRLVVPPTDQAEISAALDGLSENQLTNLGQAAAQKTLHAYVLTRGETDFINARAKDMLPPKLVLDGSEVHLTSYGSGAHRLVIDADGATRPAGFQVAFTRAVEFYRLQQAAPNTVVVSITDAGSALRVVAGDKTEIIHASELETAGDRIDRMLSFLPKFRNQAATGAADLARRHPQRLGELLAAKKLLPDNATVIDFANDLKVNLRAALKDRQVLTALNPDSAAILARLRADRPPLTIKDVSVINGLPSTEKSFAAGDMAGAWESWKNLAPAVSTVARDAGVEPIESSPDASAAKGGDKVAARAIKELMNKKGVLFVYAHSDGAAIYLGDGLWLDASRLDADTISKIRANSPDVILLSCETGGLADGRNLARALLDAGAHSVIAPRKKVGVLDANRMLERFLLEVNNGAKFEEARDRMLQLEGKSEYDIFVSQTLRDGQRQANLS